MLIKQLFLNKRHLQNMFESLQGSMHIDSKYIITFNIKPRIECITMNMIEIKAKRICPPY